MLKRLIILIVGLAVSLGLFVMTIFLNSTERPLTLWPDKYIVYEYTVYEFKLGLPTSAGNWIKLYATEHYFKRIMVLGTGDHEKWAYQILNESDSHLLIDKQCTGQYVEEEFEANPKMPECWIRRQHGR